MEENFHAALTATLQLRLSSMRLPLAEQSIDDIPNGNLFEVPDIENRYVIFHDMVSGDEKMLKIFDDIERIATANVPIFVTGETGTGKELAARACHEQGFDSNKPYIAVNCANFSEQLMESQLFGHKKGAFTDASSDHAGLFESAGEGTLFLDEITTLSLPLQAKLLRVIQEREFSPLGSHKLKPFRARIVTASSTSLADAVVNGDFREDLYYRLGVVTISLPTLRDRGLDKQLLALHFIQCLIEQEMKGHGKDNSFLTTDALNFVDTYYWPGNIRQLRNVLLGAMVLHKEAGITAAALSNQINDSVDRIGIQLREGTSQITVTPIRVITVQPLWLTEKTTIEQAIEICGGNIPRAASLLEVSPSTIYRKLQTWETA
jgi:two-component system repressor protein LuxO